MQAIIITRNDILSETVTLDMLREICTKYLDMSAEAVAKTAEQTLNKPSKLMATLSFAKLRTIVDKKLTDSPADELGELYASGKLELEFDCLPDLDIGNAGKNTKRERKATADGAPKAPRTKLSGAYDVTKKAGNSEADEGKWEIWQHVWSCTSFEEYFAKAPAKAVTKTGRVVTASSEIQWAVKCGWITPTAV